MTEPKPGILTTEFAATVAALIYATMHANPWAAVVVAVAYMACRTYAKRAAG